MKVVLIAISLLGFISPIVIGLKLSSLEKRQQEREVHVEIYVQESLEYELVKFCLVQSNNETRYYRKVTGRSVPAPITNRRSDSIRKILWRTTEGDRDLLFNLVLPILWAEGVVNDKNDIKLPKKKWSWGYPGFSLETIRRVDKTLGGKKFVRMSDTRLRKAIVQDYTYTLELHVLYVKYLREKYPTDQSIFTAYIGGEEYANGGKLLRCTRQFQIQELIREARQRLQQRVIDMPQMESIGLFTLKMGEGK